MNGYDLTAIIVICFAAVFIVDALCTMRTNILRIRRDHKIADDLNKNHK